MTEVSTGFSLAKSATLQLPVLGHFVPSKANWRNFFRDYLADPLGDVPAPGASTGTATPITSGIATPAEAASSVPAPPVAAAVAEAVAEATVREGGEARAPVRL
jgi:hypothetical protein